AGTATCRTYVEFASRISMCAGPGGKFFSVTRPSPSVAPRQPNEVAREGNRDGGCGTFGAADIRMPIAGPSGDVMWEDARPPATSTVSTVALPDTGTTREAESHTLAHRSTAPVQTLYRPAASRSNVARPCRSVRAIGNTSGDRGRVSLITTSWSG